MNAEEYLELLKNEVYAGREKRRIKKIRYALENYLRERNAPPPKSPWWKVWE